jgi:hypothetical protein
VNFFSFPLACVAMTKEATEVLFAVALRRRVGQQMGNVGRDHCNNEIACDLNVCFTTMPIEVGGGSLPSTGQPCLSLLHLDDAQLNRSH